MWIERLMAGISHQHVLSYNPLFLGFIKKEVHNEPLLLLCKIIIYSRPICKIGLIFL